MKIITEQEFDPVGLVEMSPKGQKSTRYNNALNLEYRPWQDKYGASIGEDGRFAKFPTPEAGLEAATERIKQIAASGASVAETINTWAPKFKRPDGTWENPKTPQRIIETAKMLGVSPDTPIIDVPLGPFITSQIKYESPTKVNPAFWGEAGNLPIGQSLDRQATAKAYQTNQDKLQFVTPDQFDPIEAPAPQPPQAPPIPGYAPAPGPPQAGYEDPTAASMGMFRPESAIQEMGKIVAAHPTEAGMLAAPLLPGQAAAPQFSPTLTKGAAIVRSMPYNMALAGMGASAVNLMAGKTGEPIMKGETPDVTSASLGQFNAPLEPFGVGADAQALGMGVAGLAQKLFAPAAGKITEGLRSGIDYLKSKKLPFSADIAGTGRLSQKVADWMGFGRLYTNHQRGKLVEGLSETVSDISKEIGITPNFTPTETSGAVANFLQSVTNKGPYYENFNNLVKGIPETKWPNTLDAIDALGKRIGWEGMEGNIKTTLIERAEGGLELSYKNGLKNILNVYGKSRGKPLVNELQSLIDNGGLMNGEKAASLINQLWKSVKYDNLPGTGKELIKRLKEGFMADMESFSVPGTAETLATIRAAADTATHEALKWIENSSVTGKILRLQMQGPWKIWKPKWEKHIEEGLPTMITNITKNDVMGLKDRMIEAGKPELWEAFQLAYVQKVFDSTVKDGVFDPKKYLTWYDKYGKVASEVMPELAPNLSQWANISQMVSKDFKRNKTGQLVGGLLVGGAMGGLEAMRTGDYSKLISVPIAFSTIAALGTMGPGRLGFLRNWVLKETSPIAAPAAGIAAKIAGAQLMENRGKNAVLPGSNLSFGPNLGPR